MAISQPASYRTTQTAPEDLAVECIGLIQRFERAAAEYAEACERSRRAEIPVVLTLMRYFARGSDDYESYRDRYNVLRGIPAAYRPRHRGVYLL